MIHQRVAKDMFAIAYKRSFSFQKILTPILEELCSTAM